jgi:glyoxylase-like metal-dependent hydrolase (beta-lactamase superfamily II)
MQSHAGRNAVATTSTPQFVASRTVGGATVTAISDGSGRSSVLRALLVPREEWRAEVDADEHDEVVLGYNVAHVRLGADSVLIDLGFDDPSPASQWRAPRHTRTPGVVAGLATLGVRPEDITHVPISHAHGDHIAGGSVEHEGRRTPRYSNARHFIGRSDWEGNPARDRPDALLTRHLGPVSAAGLLELVDDEREIAPGITMLAAPGESPGHCIVRVVSDGATFYFLGDLFHQPAEVFHHNWVASTHDAAALRASRATLIGAALANNALLMTTHMPFPGFGRLHQDQQGLHWVEA